MTTERTAATSINKEEGPRDCVQSDDDDEASDPSLFSYGGSPSRNEPIRSHRGCSWTLGTRWERRLQSWALPSFHRARQDGRQWYSYNVAPAAEAGESRVTTNTSGEADAAASRSHSFMFTLQAIAFSTWANLLLIFVPMGIVAHLCKGSPPIVFTSNAIAIIPLSGLLTYATESIASDMGDTIGALMNISFGNLAEVIILIALFHDQMRIVQASLLGSILVNLLLILGSAIIAGSFQDQEQAYNLANTQTLACLLCVSVFSFVIPTAFHHSFADSKQADQAVLKLSRASAIILLVIYVLYLIFQLRSLRQFVGPGMDPEGLVRSRASSLRRRSQEFGRARSVSLSRTIRFANGNFRSAVDPHLQPKTIHELDTIE